MNLFSSRSIDSTYKIVVLSVILIAVLYLAGNIIFPLIFALFFSFSLLGSVRWLERLRFPRFVAAALMVLIATSFIVGVILFIGFQGYYLIDDLNEISATTRFDFVENFGTWFMEQTGADVSRKGEAINMISEKLIAGSGQLISTTLSMLGSTMTFMSLVPLYALLLLTYRSRFRLFLTDHYNRQERKGGLLILEEIASMVQSYLAGLGIVIVIVSILFSVGLWFIGVPYALMLGVLTGILIIVPYIGAIIGALLPAVVAFLTMEHWWYSLIVIAWYVFVQLLEGNVLTPLIVGKNVNLNPLVIIIGMVILAGIGGILAMIIAVPLIAVVKIILSHSERFKSVTLLMDQNMKKK